MRKSNTIKIKILEKTTMALKMGCQMRQNQYGTFVLRVCIVLYYQIGKNKEARSHYDRAMIFLHRALIMKHRTTQQQQ